MEAYGVYVGNFKNAQDTIIRLKSEKNSRFSAWIQEISSKYHDGSDLLTLISLPVNHISKIEPIIENLTQFIDKNEENEIENLNNAWNMIKETSKFITQSLLHSDTAFITNLQRRITGYLKPLNLIKPDRKFISEALFSSFPEKKKIYLFLFNDILLVTSPQKNVYKFKDILNLENIQFLDDLKGEKNGFLLKTNSTNGDLKLIAKTNEEKIHWMKMFHSLEEERKVNRTIGVELSSLLSREVLLLSSSSSSDRLFFYFYFFFFILFYLIDYLF